MTRPRIGLDWRSAVHWGGGRRLPCVHCGEGAFCRDETGRPSHKTCAETVMRYAADLAARNGADDASGALGLDGEAA
ncbi:hypothetical protein ACH35V_06810 [Actinomadura sp. 1N219]|uniref:hypothetical protein n=1 Tax=Actinomadura sp. 1N219 TaxID=3375152 RepID=UPI0037932C46